MIISHNKVQGRKLRGIKLVASYLALVSKDVKEDLLREIGDDEA